MMTLRYLLLAWFVFDTLAIYLFARKLLLGKPLTIALLSWTINGAVFQSGAILNAMGILSIQPTDLNLWGTILRMHIATVVGVLALYHWRKL
jgi:hypothetical protein